VNDQVLRRIQKLLLYFGVCLALTT